MKITNLLSTTAMTVVLTAGVVAAQDLGSSSFAAGVSLLAPEQTGFLLGSTVEVTGLGSGAAAVSAQNASFNMTGFANSNSSDTANVGTEANANSGVLTTFQFDRTVAASGSSVGAGRVVAQGEANATVSAVGSAFGDTLSNAIQDATVASVAGQLGSTSNATSESAASLIGEGSTSVLAGLIGTSSNFVGSTGTEVVTTQLGVAYSALNALGDAAGVGITVTPGAGGTFAALDTEISNLGDGLGVIGFSTTMGFGANDLDLAVANVGGGTISLGATTGGFFGGGAATTGASGFGSVFTAP
jgi:hypothetical protein